MSNVVKDKSIIQKEIETSDFYFVVFLKTIGFIVANVRKAEGQKKLIFTLSGTILNGTVDPSTAYYTNAAVVKVQDFAREIKALKSYIYDGEGKDLLSRKDV